MSTIDIRVTGDAARKLAAMNGQFNPWLRETVLTAGYIVEREAKRNVTVFQGHLRRSLATEVRGLGDTVTAAIGSNLPQARPVEFGRKPGKMPPPDALRPWVAKKLGPNVSAYVVARAIGRRGTRAQPYLIPALEDNRDRIVRHFEARLRSLTRGA